MKISGIIDNACLSFQTLIFVIKNNKISKGYDLREVSFLIIKSWTIILCSQSYTKCDKLF